VTQPRPLRPCGRGSCVSTQAPVSQPLRRIEPLRFEASAADAMRALLTVLARTPRTRILERDDVAVHAVTRSAFLRVGMDLEVTVDSARGLLDLRASTSLSVREQTGSRRWAMELLGRIEKELRAAG